MSEEKYKAGEVYDLTQNVKNAEINTGFILGLERILIYFLTNVIEDKASIPGMFKKFEDLLTTEKVENKPEFTEVEANIYTIFALQQLLRSLAYEQNLVKKIDTTVKESDVKDLLKAYIDNNTEEVKNIYDKIQTDLSSKI